MVLLLLLMATLLHVLLTTMRRRTPDIAVLRVVGWAPRRLRSTLRWQPLVLAGAAPVIGVPIGLLAGRVVWSVFTDQLGVTPASCGGSARSHSSLSVCSRSRRCSRPRPGSGYPAARAGTASCADSRRAALTIPSHSHAQGITAGVCTRRYERRGRPADPRGLIAVLTFVAALVVAFALRRGAVIGIALLSLVFVPLEKLWTLRPQKVFRRGLLTDLTHLLVNNFLIAAATIVLVIAAALPLLWVRRLDLEAALPPSVAVALAVVLVFVGNYWGHRLTHQVPFLWRFHSVHHSIEQMDWLASGRLHPLDSAFTQGFTVLPLVLLGYDGGVFAGVAVAVALLALFQHANVRVRFPGLRWVVNTPEWHHWHHAIDDDARDKNFGLPIVDVLFGTAYMPRDRRPTGFGIHDPVPATGYLAHLAYPFTVTGTRTEAATATAVRSTRR